MNHTPDSNRNGSTVIAITLPSADDDLINGTHAFHEHLRENEAELLRHNIIVRVESMHLAHRAALCTVRQRHAGLLRRSRSNNELVWRAEQALAPLLVLGISPLVQVLGRRPLPLAPHVAGLRAWLRRMAKRLGYPGAAPITAAPPVPDPFGWRSAVARANSTAP